MMFDLGGIGDMFSDAAQNIVPDGLADAVQPDGIVDGASDQIQNVSDQATETLGNTTEGITDSINPFN